MAGGAHSYSRRAILSAGAATVLGGCLNRSDAAGDGIADYLEQDGGLEDYLSERYYFTGSLDPDSTDILVDAIYVDGVNRTPRAHITWIEDYFAREVGANLIWLERLDEIPRHTYNTYPATVDALLCGDDSLYTQEAYDSLQYTAHQLFFVPDQQVYKDGRACEAYNTGTRSVIGDDTQRFRSVLAAHELGHSLGLSHVAAANPPQLMEEQVRITDIRNIRYTADQRAAMRENAGRVLDLDRDGFAAGCR